MNESKTQCLIVDDEPLAIKVIEKHLEKVSDIYIVATCHSAWAAFDIVQRQPVDLIFLDIQMPELNGIDFVKSLDQPPKIIFTTARRDFALDGFELDAVDYLLKPISLPRLLRAVDKYRRLTQRSPHQQTDVLDGNAYLTVRANRQTIRIPLADIVFIESLSDYTKIHLANRVIVCKERISHLAKKLEPAGFLRIHRSFIVPLSRISSYTADEVNVGTTSLPISRSYRQLVRELLGRLDDNK